MQLRLIVDNKLTPTCTPHYLRHRLENAIVSTLSSSPGLFIHCQLGVYESGKTTDRHIAQRLQDDQYSTVIFRKGYHDIPGLSDPDCDLYTCLSLPSSSCAQFISKPTTLIIDHFDTFVWAAPS
jgi:S-ribosylhomocysteine lyase LuxS involved in autoinducer biosynthesis